MPVHNGESFLKPAIDSILNQTFQDFEFIIINDGSTDRSNEIISSYTDNRIQLIHHDTNLGIVHSLNEGVAQSTGEFIARMDCDDLSRPKRLERQLKFLEENKDVNIVGAWIKLFGHVRRNFVHKYPVQSKAIKSLMLFENPLAHPTVMFRREILNQKGKSNYLTNFPHVEDWAFWFELSKKYKFANISEVLLDYRVHKSSASKKNTRAQKHSVIQLQKEMFSYYNLPFSEEFLPLNLQWSKKNCSNFSQYLNTLIEENKRKKIFEEAAFNHIVSKVFLKFVRGANSDAFFAAIEMIKFGSKYLSLNVMLVSVTKILVMTHIRRLIK
ncbi:hypothetical protein NBRC116602_24050 [Hyphomicrobiales bacterium 4NK60-0047b]